VCVLEHGHGSGAVQKAACGDVGIVRGETTLKAKAWVVKGWPVQLGGCLTGNGRGVSELLCSSIDESRCSKGVGNVELHKL
jgi:hypothetical protein